VQDREPLSVSGYSSEALAAAAYDHARIWQALQQDKEGADMERQRAAVQRLNGELNHGLQRYVADTRLLGKLGGCTRAQLHEQLQPRVLPGWAPWLDTPAVTTRFLGVKRTQGSAQLSAMLHGGCLVPLLHSCVTLLCTCARFPRRGGGGKGGHI
jgi:hypothetical protein